MAQLLPRVVLVMIYIALEYQTNVKYTGAQFSACSGRLPGSQTPQQAPVTVVELHTVTDSV